ncbi:uncharacterized protein LOC120338966 [Styela clava]
MSGRKIQSDATAVPKMYTGGKSTKQYVEDTVREAMAEVNRATGHLGTVNPGKVSYNTSGGGSAINQFNIVGGTIGQAAIGNRGDTVFNEEKKVFQKGASNTKYNISGGNFNQANIGGTSHYNNKECEIGSGGGGKGVSLSAEDLTLSILDKGVTAEQFVLLLERKYSLANIAFAMPSDPELKNRMVDALLVK